MPAAGKLDVTNMESALEKQRRASAAPAQEQQRRTSRYGSLPALEKQRRVSNFTRLSLDQSRQSNQYAPLDKEEQVRRSSQFSRTTLVQSRPVSQFVTLNEEEKPRRPSQFANLSPAEVSTTYQALDNNERETRETSRKRKRKCLLITLIIASILVVAGLGVGLGIGLTRNTGEMMNNGGDTSYGPNTGMSSGTSTTSAPIPGSTSIAYDARLATSTSTWQPRVGSSWQIQIYGAITNLTVPADVFNIDLFDNTAENITQLHTFGRKVICYFSAGSYENFRIDAGVFEPTDYGKDLVGWPGEYWLNTNSANVRKIMVARLNLAASKGCDGIDPDNVDGFDGHDTGFPLTANTAVEYMTFLASEAHSRNMSIGLKNAGSIVSRTLNMMQWEINESCEEYDECDLFQPFIKAAKPVFHIEYDLSTPKPTTATIQRVCDNGTSINGFSTVLKNSNLNEWLYTCP